MSSPVSTIDDTETEIAILIIIWHGIGSIILPDLRLNSILVVIVVPKLGRAFGVKDDDALH